jgi:site-specific DNA recombinase
MMDIYKTQKGTVRDERKEISEQIAKLQSKLANAREMVFDEKLDADDYAIMKRECDEKLKRLEIALMDVKIQKSNTMSIDKMVLKAVEALSNLKTLYADGDVLKKREILGSIYREKLCFDGTEYRTGRLNDGAQLIFQINKGLRGNKNGKDRLSNRLSRRVLGAGIEPARL